MISNTNYPVKKMQLFSNYRDYFDMMFDREGEPFIRFSTDYFSRRDAFKILDRTAGMMAVEHGLVKDLLWSDKDLVVYLDEKAHTANEKIVISKHERNDYLNYYSSVVHGLPAVSIRILNIGNRQFKLRYESDDAFFSNKGNVEISLLDELIGNQKYPNPLFCSKHLLH